MNEFKILGLKAGTDKVTHHGYHRFYHSFLKDTRLECKGIFEIGIDRTASIKLWKEYFPQAHIYGMDIGFSIDEDRVTIFKGDQNNVMDLEMCIQKFKHPISFINDDGSHIPEHQILSFNHLFKVLQDGGIYIIEDIETSYWTKNDCYGYPTNYGYKNPKSCIELFKPVVDFINKEFLTSENKTNLLKELDMFSIDILEMISTITFCQNCIIIKKKLPEEHAYTNRDYRFWWNL